MIRGKQAILDVAAVLDPHLVLIDMILLACIKYHNPIITLTTTENTSSKKISFRPHTFLQAYLYSVLIITRISHIYKTP